MLRKSVPVIVKTNAARSSWLGIITLFLAVVCVETLITPLTAFADSRGHTWKVVHFVTATPYCLTTSFCLGLSRTSNGRGSTIYASQDGGKTLKEIAAITGSSTSYNYLSAISCSNAATCVAVGNGTGTLHGRSVADPFVSYANASTKEEWRSVALATYAGIPLTQQTVSAISCANADDCVAVGGTQQSVPLMWATTNGGATWRLITTLPKNFSIGALRAVSCTSSTSCVALGGDILFTTSGPAHFAIARGPKKWTATTPVYSGQANPDYVNYEYFAALACLPKGGECVVVGTITPQRVSASGTYSPGTSSLIIATSLNGATWTSVTSIKAPKNTVLDSISCPVAKRCVAAGVSGSSRPNDFGGTPVILETVSSLRTWSAVKIRKLPTLPKDAGEIPQLSCATAAFCTVYNLSSSKSVNFDLVGPA